MRIALVAGTRPEIIKLAPVRQLLGHQAFTIHTNQHYSTGFAGDATPDLVLDPIPAATPGQQLGSWTGALDHAYREHHPDAVLVQGDTTTTLAGALAATTTRTPLIHIEAGLRSHDRSMPEEHNRVVVDHLADLCCTPSEHARDNLIAERISADRIVTTGNTILESVTAALPPDDEQTRLLEQLGLNSEDYVLATIHRPENVDDAGTLESILQQLALLPVPVVLPLHPRTQQRIEAAGLANLAANLRMTGPLDYPALLTMIKNSTAVVSDSGGIQEEITALKRPIVVVRRSNERPETEHNFGIRVPAGPDIHTVITRWLADPDALHTRLAQQPSPYGDGSATVRILRAIQQRMFT